MFWKVETVYTSQGETLEGDLQRLDDGGWTIVDVICVGGRGTPEFKIVANRKSKPAEEKKANGKKPPRPKPAPPPPPPRATETRN